MFKNPRTIAFGAIAFALRSAFLGQAAVGGVVLRVEHRLEAAGPGLRDAMLAQLGDQCIGLGVFQLAERPVKQMDVRIDDVGSRGWRWFRALRRAVDQCPARATPAEIASLQSRRSTLRAVLHVPAREC